MFLCHSWRWRCDEAEVRKEQFHTFCAARSGGSDSRVWNAPAEGHERLGKNTVRHTLFHHYSRRTISLTLMTERFEMRLNKKRYSSRNSPAATRACRFWTLKAAGLHRSTVRAAHPLSEGDASWWYYRTAFNAVQMKRAADGRSTCRNPFLV